MSQNMIIGVLGAVILIGGGAWLYQSQSEDGGFGMMKSRNDNPERTGMDDDDDGGLLGELGDVFSGRFSDLMARGQSVYCTFDGTDPDTGEDVEGSLYADGDNFAMEADTTVEGTALTMNIIQKDRVMYMWSDNPEVMPAMKIDTSMFPEGEEGAPESPIDFLDDPESGVDYSCRGWAARASTFEPPTDIEFNDMFGGMMEAFGAMMQQGMMGEGEAGFDDSGSYDSWGVEENY